MKHKIKLFSLILAVAVLLSACAPQVATTVTAQPTATPSAAMPNPAAKYCTDQGFESEIRTAADGSQYGVCKFPDGSECDEWAYRRGKCKQGEYNVAPTPTSSAEMPNPAAKYCADQGFESEIRTAADGSQYGVCKFPDGSECDEWAYRRGECEQGEYTVAPTPAPTTTD